MADKHVIDVIFGWTVMVLVIFILQGCEKKVAIEYKDDSAFDIDARFTLMPSATTSVTFSNFADSFKEDYNYNIFRYEYLYNGGGVAAGDVNGDSLPDLYFTATFAPNKLYLNLGDFKFLDVTAISGVEAGVGFKTGTTMADINGDGKLDIYSCRTGKDDDGKKTDHVYINTGNKIENGVAVPVFEDQAKQLGLADNSNTNHVCFFDFDRDGDLDLFQLNHRVDFETSTNFRLEQGEDGSIRRITSPSTPFESNKLYRNDNGRFIDITTNAGMVSSAYGLSVTPADLNQDGWTDLYLGIDYIEPDMVYINNKDGTFTDRNKEYLKHSSLNSMGSDIADINNDGLDDIMVLDMKPEDPLRYKTLINGMQYDRYNLLVQNGYGRQVGRNILQLNNGNNTFSEIGQFAGVATTDWSWGSLIADFDNDGWKDIYVANGYRRDVANLDYLNYIRDSLHQTGGLTAKRFPDINDILDYVPEKKISNYLFINNKKLGFDNATKRAGVDQLSYSNGSAYADLDRDGDLDLIVNNLIEPAFIYRNDVTGKNWLQIKVEEKGGNSNGLGVVADIFVGNDRQHQTQITNKGFFSSSEPVLHFGLGEIRQIDSILLKWTDGTSEIMRNVDTNQRIIWKRGSGQKYTYPSSPKQDNWFTDNGVVPGWKHQENAFVDFKRERLLPYMLSFEGPCLSTGDVNGDQLEDIFVGNGSGFPAALFIQTKQNNFLQLGNEVFQADAAHEDCGSVLEDLDADGDLDLVVISGGSSFNLNDPAYMTRHYVNDGKGIYTRSNQFPIIRTNAGAILAFDYDNDQDKDLFIAGRATPGGFPAPPKSYLLRNDKGKFLDVTQEVFRAFDALGMITDLESGDLDGDGRAELIVCGDWMPIQVFSFDGSIFQDQTDAFGLTALTGWWKSVEVDDLDGDGDLDIVAGNMGLNHRMATSELYPVTLISNDFDDNGSQDPVLSFFYEGKLYPYASRDALIGQVPMLKKKYVRYTPYASAPIEEIFTKEKLKGSKKLTANTFKTVCLMNSGKAFSVRELPYQTQFSPVFDIVVKDVNGDGRKDILMAGNFLYSETETGEMDAGIGTLLIQMTDGSFQYVPNREHGFWASYEVRELKAIEFSNGQSAILTGNNQGPIQVHTLTRNEN